MLAVQTFGSGAAPPLVMLHGFLCAGSFFAPVARALSARYRVITLDLPGFGESRQVAAVDSIGAFADSVQQTLTALGVRRYHLLGHSMGGMVALQLALQAPAQTASLMVYGSNSSGELPERFETFAESKRRLQVDFASAKRRICATWLIAGERGAGFALLQQCAAAVALPTAEKAIDAMAAFDVSARLRELNMPVLIISAENDRTYSLACQRQLMQRIPHAEQYVIKDCAHCAHLETSAKTEEFNRLLGDWLERV